MAKHKFASISLTVRDRAISSKFSTHRVSKECTFCNFQKNFPSPKMAAILNFRIFAKNGKTQICFYLLNRVTLSDFVEIFDPRVFEQCTLGNFKKFSPPQKWWPFKIFKFLPKMAKHKIASISLTVRDRAISSKFSTHWLSQKCTLSNFQKNFPYPKMVTILNFRIFAKNGKTRICFYLLNRAR